MDLTDDFMKSIPETSEGVGNVWYVPTARPFAVGALQQEPLTRRRGFILWPIPFLCEISGED